MLSVGVGYVEVGWLVWGGRRSIGILQGVVHVIAITLEVPVI